MIQFSGVHKTYPRQINVSAAHHALKGISLTLGKGQTLGLIGQNGAGKSTSIRLIMGYMRPDQGKVSVLGDENSSPSTRRHIGYLPEISALPANLTCLELLRFVGRCSGMQQTQMKERADMLLHRLGIWHARKRRLNTYSKGMQQRASFAAALIHGPELLVLDEPMSGLDPIGRSEIIELIHGLHDQGKSILFCSHLLDDVEIITDRVAIIHQGCMLYDGAITELCAHQSQWSVDLRNGEIMTVHDEAQLPELLRQYADQIVGVRHDRERLQDSFVRIIQGSGD